MAGFPVFPGSRSRIPGNSQDFDCFPGPEILESGFSGNFQTLVFKISPLPAVVVVAEGSAVVVVAEESVVAVAGSEA